MELKGQSTVLNGMETHISWLDDPFTKCVDSPIECATNGHEGMTSVKTLSGYLCLSLDTQTAMPFALSSARFAKEEPERAKIQNVAAHATMDKYRHVLTMLIDLLLLLIGC